MNGGPQATADIVISNGMQMLVDGTFHTAVEFCINDGGAELPPELFVFVNASMGDTSPESNQLSTIDSTCSCQGLTLLQSYGLRVFGRNKAVDQRRNMHSELHTACSNVY